MSYVTVSRVAIGALLISIAALAILRVDLPLQVAAMIIGIAAVFIVLWPRAPLWGDRALAVLGDRDLVQREMRRSMMAFGLFLVVAVVLGFLSGLLIPAR